MTPLWFRSTSCLPPQCLCVLSPRQLPTHEYQRGRRERVKERKNKDSQSQVDHFKASKLPGLSLCWSSFGLNDRVIDWFPVTWSSLDEVCKKGDLKCPGSGSWADREEKSTGNLGEGKEG